MDKVWRTNNLADHSRRRRWSDLDPSHAVVHCHGPKASGLRVLGSPGRARRRRRAALPQVTAAALPRLRPFRGRHGPSIPSELALLPAPSRPRICPPGAAPSMTPCYAPPGPGPATRRPGLLPCYAPPGPSPVGWTGPLMLRAGCRPLPVNGSPRGRWLRRPWPGGRPDNR